MFQYLSRSPMLTEVVTCIGQSSCELPTLTRHNVDSVLLWLQVALSTCRKYRDEGQTRGCLNFLAVCLSSKLTGTPSAIPE
ncbi:hypothetical protein AQUCO_04900229v1 [Aquilegia coerulea]|uniref:Uncharacterized protein n=1 Tax=Aquilegia coerulea TaxID=218851 RepID=A0A2G5CKI3_AQUCA|nr:hypothetical protein AQUCO_04900229v1 [Aquilegia coerulea]